MVQVAIVIMSNLQELSEEQLHEGIAAATRQIGAYNNELLRRKRSSESASSSSAAPSPKTPRTEESDDSDTEPEDYHVLKSTPIYVRRTEECGQNCELCPHVFQGESLPNMYVIIIVYYYTVCNKMMNQ